MKITWKTKEEILEDLGYHIRGIDSLTPDIDKLSGDNIRLRSRMLSALSFLRKAKKQINKLKEDS